MDPVTAMVQARMASTRLPGKVMAEIGGNAMLWYVLERIKRAKLVNRVVVLTSDQSADNILAEYCTSNQIDYYRGSEEDVLDRYYQAALLYKAKTIVRVTGDCPLIDSHVIDRVIELFLSGRHDYVSNTLPPTYPDGLDVEVFSLGALKRTWEEAKLRSEREHVTPYIRNHPDIFCLGNVSNSKDLSRLRWTVDEPRDLEFVRAIYFRLGNTPFSMEDILRLLTDHPELKKLNEGIFRNEGYLKSLREDILIKE